MKTPPKLHRTPKPKAWAQTGVEAATALGVSRKTLRLWVDLAGSPGKTAAGKYDLHAWRRWVADNKPEIAERRGSEADSPALSRKQQIAQELAEEQLRKVKRENADAENRTMATDDVDGLIFEVLANFDFHLTNAERELSLKFAELSQVTPSEARKIVKPSFDSFRGNFNHHPLSADVKRELNAWMAIPFETRERIMAGNFPVKGMKKAFLKALIEGRAFS